MYAGIGLGYRLDGIKKAYYTYNIIDGVCNMENTTYKDIMSGQRDSNIKFADLQLLLNRLGFECRIKGDHFIYYRNDIPEIINIQL